ncbi:Kinesin-like protein [Phytophthora palmivora]|uniref:Kinesin-like protein n=1 Tax=Phytophthora palmivora TaxID=4796 RepID=A0A2P4XH87_9STRA|nr:Kinesin-like protein [Phytophthora palmivora]
MKYVNSSVNSSYFLKRRIPWVIQTQGFTVLILTVAPATQTPPQDPGLQVLRLREQGPTHGPNGEGLVGEEEPGAIGFSLGLVHGAARPSTMDTGKQKIYRGSIASSSPSGMSPTSNGQRSPSALRSPSGVELPDVPDNSEDGGDNESLYNSSKGGGDQDPEIRAKNNAFQFYRSAGPGRKLHQNLQEEKDKLFDAKQRVKQVTRRVNAAKAQIDMTRAQLEEKRNQRRTNDGTGNPRGGAKPNNNMTRSWTKKNLF